MRFFYTVIFVITLKTLFAQDPLTGVYSYWGIFDRLTIKSDNTFELHNPKLNNGKPFYGTWLKVNDTLIHVKSDSVILSVMNDPGYVEFYFSFSDGNEIGWWYIGKTYDSTAQKRPLAKEETFYDDGGVKSKKQFFSGRDGYVLENYYPSGQLKEVVGYKNDLQHGVYLLYDINGKLGIMDKNEAA